MKKPKSKKRIFISHSEKNKDFVQLILNYLVSLGAPKSVIFCSSDYETGVQTKISDDVFQALQNTELDIIVLSNEYKKSEYCLCEAGVIRSKEGHSVKIVIVFPDIQNGDYAGFINEDYLQYRFDSKNFIEALGKRFQNELVPLHLMNVNHDQREMMYKVFQKELDTYQKSLPTIENLTINWATGDALKRARLNIKQAYENIRGLAVYERNDNRPDDHVFYQQYERSVMIGKGTHPGKILVNTITRYTIVNLSNKDIKQRFSAQFLKIDGGVDTLSKDIIIINGQENSDLIREFTKTQSNSEADSPYIMSSITEITTKAHSSDHVFFQNTYEISPDLFFQAKVVRFPCGQYCIRANFEKSLYNIVKKKNYIFRYQVIPPDPYDLGNHLIPSHLGGGSADKTSVQAQYNNGFPAGGGYALSLSKVSHPFKPEKGKKCAFFRKSRRGINRNT